MSDRIIIPSVAFVEDHDMGDQDAGERTMWTVVPFPACRDCEVHFAAHSVPCLAHTSSSNRLARTKAIGVVR